VCPVRVLVASSLTISAGSRPNCRLSTSYGMIGVYGAIAEIWGRRRGGFTPASFPLPPRAPSALRRAAISAAGAARRVPASALNATRLMRLTKSATLSGLA